MKKIDMKKVISNIKTVNKKKLFIFGSAATLIGGTIAFVSCNANNQNVNNASIVTDDTNLDKNNSMKSYENNIENIYEDFEQYFSSSSDDFKKEFYRQQNILTPENIQEAMERIINIYLNDNLKKYAEQILKVYIPHYEQMCSLAKDREL